MIAYFCFIGALDNVYVFNYRRGKYVPIFNLIAPLLGKEWVVSSTLLHWYLHLFHQVLCFSFNIWFDVSSTFSQSTEWSTCERGDKFMLVGRLCVVSKPMNSTTYEYILLLFIKKKKRILLQLSKPYT